MVFESNEFKVAYACNLSTSSTTQSITRTAFGYDVIFSIVLLPFWQLMPECLLTQKVLFVLQDLYHLFLTGNLNTLFVTSSKNFVPRSRCQSA